MRYTTRKMSNAADVLRQAMQLSTEERAALAVQLIKSVDGPEDENAEIAWAREIEKRAKDAVAGTSSSEEWTAVRDEIKRNIVGG